MSERDIRDIPLSVHRSLRITNVFRGALIVGTDLLEEVLGRCNAKHAPLSISRRPLSHQSSSSFGSSFDSGRRMASLLF